MEGKMKKIFKRVLLSFCATAFVSAATCMTASAGVDVFAEGAYTTDKLDVYIYADTEVDLTAEILCSHGIKLSYDTAKLEKPTATRNLDVWYFGADAPGHDCPNCLAIDETGGTVTMVGGKLDTDNPTEGVTGDRILLGIVSFDRLTHETPVSSFPEYSYFNITIELGKKNPTIGETYHNFVTVDETPLDGCVTFPTDDSSLTIRERGDANGSRTINVQDILNTQSYIGASDYPPWADCNAVGGINVQDILCTQSKI